MGDVTKGLEAGFIATIFVSIVLFAQQALGFMPNFNLIDILQTSAGTQNQPVLGWGLHFVIGVGLWGAGFAAFSPHLPGPHWLRGLTFGALAWLVMMIAFLPSAGMPMFAAGVAGGMSIAIYTLALHLFFGLVLGESYHLLLHFLPSEVDENA
ncbi:MAG TPA: DUF6789 family protein [Rhizomicrobium sp.]|nr:DUF6789 family protein [Rhizomicrobium sp.]